MSRTLINVAAVMDAGSHINSAKASVSSAKSAFTQIRYSIDGKIQNRSDIRNRLSMVQNQLSNIDGQIGKIRSTVQSGAELYRSTDDRVESWRGNIRNAVGARASSGSVSNWASYFSNSGEISEPKERTIFSTLNKMLGKAGYLGNVVSFFTKPIAKWAETGTFSVEFTGAESVAKFLKDGNSAIKGLSEWAKSNKQLDKLARMLPEQAQKTRINRLFGFNDTFKGGASKAGKWSTRFYNNFHKQNGPLDSYKSGGAKSAFAWTGLVFSAAGNTISNIEEAKTGEITAGRAVAETIVETAVDVGKNWVIGTAVAAGIAATIGSAPVLAVGLGTMAVSAGLDFACKKITGAITGTEKGLTETVSDLALDVGTAVVKGGAKLISSVDDFVKSKFNVFGKGMRTLFA